MYEFYPDSSPLVWVLFSLASLFAVMLGSGSSRKLLPTGSSTIAGLKIVFWVWLLSGFMFFAADRSLAIYPLNVDQLAIQILILIHPLAVFFHDLPAPWFPALVATLFVLLLALSGFPLEDSGESPSRLMRPVYACVRSLNRLTDFLKGSGLGRRVISAVSTYAKWAGLLKAASLGILAFGLSIAVGGSSMTLRHAEIVDAFLTQPLRAHADWRQLEGDIVVSSTAAVLDADWKPSRRCSDGQSVGDCDQAPSQLHSLPPEWAGTVPFHQPPYPPPSHPPGNTPPWSPNSGPGSQPDSGAPGQPFRAEQSAEISPVHPSRKVLLTTAGTSRGRLYDQVTASMGGAWDAARRAVVPDTSREQRRFQFSDSPKQSPLQSEATGKSDVFTSNMDYSETLPFDRIPGDVTPAQVRAARISFEERAGGGPAFAWSSDFVASLLKFAEVGGTEGVKQLVSHAVDSQLPVGEVVGEFVDLFLTGPKIEEVAATAEEYVRSRRFEPIISLSAKANQAARGPLGKLRQLWAFSVDSDTPDDRKVTGQFLKHEMSDIFDKSFDFGGFVPKLDLNRVRETLIDAVIPGDGSFDIDTVDRVMTVISNASNLAAPKRFKRLVALKHFGADTASIEQLKQYKLSKTAEDALNAGNPDAKFSSSELKPGWMKTIDSYAMRAWLEGEEGRRADIIGALAPFRPNTIRCGICVDRITKAYRSGPHCWRPDQQPPCPPVAGPEFDFPLLRHKP